MSRFPPGSAAGADLANAAVGKLYNSIPHPVADYVGPEFVFRQADGSYNNIHDPYIGKAGTRYARSVQPKRSIAASSLPDPGLVFDSLLKARDVRILQFHPHTILLTRRAARRPHRWQLQFDLCLCLSRHTLPLPQSPHRLDDERHLLLPRPFPSLRAQPSRPRHGAPKVSWTWSPLPRHLRGRTPPVPPSCRVGAVGGVFA